jgi:hypothetical protein
MTDGREIWRYTYGKQDKMTISGLESLLERYHDVDDLPDGE